MNAWPQFKTSPRRPRHPLRPRPLARAHCASTRDHPRVPGQLRRVPRCDRTFDRSQSPTGAMPPTRSTSCAHRLPGYGFSDRPVDPRAWCARGWPRRGQRLMARLGYDQYGAQGGDWGSAVTSVLGESHKDRVVGIHVNMPTVMLGPHRRRQHRAGAKELRGLRVAHPVGHGIPAATIDPPADARLRPRRFAGGPTRVGDGEVLGVDRLRRQIRTTSSPASSSSTTRPCTGSPAPGRRPRASYWESAGPIVASEIATTGMAPGMGQVTVPTGCSVFPKEIRRPSRRWAAERFKHIHYWNEPAKGGHFAAFEQPELFVNEVRSSFRPLR